LKHCRAWLLFSHNHRHHHQWTWFQTITAWPLLYTAKIESLCKVVCSSPAYKDRHEECMDCTAICSFSFVNAFCIA
jgi:hypothetical protein